jgi:pimeloyl-ACP methyl ester carboxylesterase
MIMADIFDPFRAMYSDQYVTVNGLRLHYTDWSSDSSDVILLLHGLNVQLHTWDPIAADLSKHFRVLALDLRGHGDSDWSRSGYNVTDFDEDIAAFCRELGLHEVTLVTHSLGARIGLVTAGRHPDLVTSLFLSDSAPEMPRSTAASVSTFMANTSSEKGFRDRKEVYDYYRQLHPEWLDIFIELHVQYQVRLNWANKLVLKADPDLYWITRGVGVREIPFLWEMARAIKCPTVIMHGAHSTFFDEDILRKMQEAIPQASLVTFDTGHYIPRERPAEFAACVLNHAEAATSAS